MIKQVISKINLNEAYGRVYRNKGVGGVDNVHITELKSIIKTNGRLYNQQIEGEAYQVSPILGVEIPKSNGENPIIRYSYSSR